MTDAETKEPPKNENENSENVGIKELREKQIEIDELNSILLKDSNEIVFLQENIAYEENRYKQLKEEYQTKYDYEEQLYQEIEDLKGSESNEAMQNIHEMRKRSSRETLQEEMTKRVKKLRLLAEGNVDFKENPYFQLVYDHIKISYIGKTYAFKINRFTNFSEIKEYLHKIENLNEPLSSYCISNEINALIINEKQKIDEYLKLYSTFNNTFNLEILSDVKFSKSLTPLQESRLSENLRSLRGGRSKQGPEVDVNFDFTQKKIKDFNAEYPLLEIYQKDEKKAKLLPLEKTSKETATNIETSFFMFLILILLFALTIISIYSNRDIGRSQIIKDFIQENFSTKDVYDRNSLYLYLSKKIGYSFLNDTIVTSDTKKNTFIDEERLKIIANILEIEENLWSSYPNMTVLNKKAKEYKSKNSHGLVLTSSIKFIVKKVVSKQCEVNFFTGRTLEKESTTIGCFEPIYSDSTAFKAKISNTDLLANTLGFKNFSTFISSSQSDISLDHFSLIGKSDGSGYQADISKSTDLVVYLSDLAQFIPISPNFQNYSPNPDYPETNNEFLPSRFFYTKENRALNIFFTLYLPSNKYFYSVNVNFYFLPTGVISSEEVIVEEFVFNIFKFGSSLATDAIRFILMIFMLFLFIYNFYLTPTKQKLEYFLGRKQKLSMVVILFYLIIFFVKIANINKKNKNSFDGSLFIDSSSLSYHLNNVYNLECLFLIIISIKLTNFLELNDSIKLYFRSLHNFFKTSFFYALFFIPVILIFTSINYIMFGPYVDESSEYYKAYRNTLLLPVGGLNIAKWIYVNEFWAILFAISYYYFLIFMLIVVFISVFVEELRDNIIVRGYPSDHETSSWTAKDYVRWLCFCIDY